MRSITSHLKFRPVSSTPFKFKLFPSRAPTFRSSLIFYLIRLHVNDELVVSGLRIRPQIYCWYIFILLQYCFIKLLILPKGFLMCLFLTQVFAVRCVCTTWKFTHIRVHKTPIRFDCTIVWCELNIVTIVRFGFGSHFWCGRCAVRDP